MPLYLVQHGLALPKDIDSERGLSEDGFADVRRIAETAKHYNVQVSQIFHSGKKRAKQTADIIAEALTPFNTVSCSMFNAVCSDMFNTSLYRFCCHELTYIKLHIPCQISKTNYYAVISDSYTSARN